MYDITIDFIIQIVHLLPVFFGIRVLFDYCRIFIFNEGR